MIHLGTDGNIYTSAACGALIAEVSHGTGDESAKGEWGRRLVHRHNLHDELVLCCKIARSELTQGTPGGITDALWRLDAVLKKAEAPWSA